jgi:FlaA1/EpsC-like NDP-sugar epimerase
MRFAIGAGFDALAWVVAIVAATLLRYDVAPSGPDWAGVGLVLPIAVGLQVGSGALLGLYRGRYKIASFEELGALVGMVLTTTVGLLVVNLVIGRPVPASIPVIAGAFALGLCAGSRYVWRALADTARRPSGAGVTRLLVFGAGDTGAQVVRLLLHNPQSRYLPVAFLDDNPSKARLRVQGVPVRGRGADLARVATEAHATAVLLAAPSAPAEVSQALAQAARAAGLEVRALPSIDQLIRHGVAVSDIRPLVDAELIGREPAAIDVEAVRGSVTGKCVLVTGAGGSIGAEISRHVASLGPSQLVMLDRDESSLHATQLSIDNNGLLDSPSLVVADIRDRARIDEVFATWSPEVVFHAAALKHLPLLEHHPVEAIKTNVTGTRHVLDAALRHHVQRFVNISTDKAANPISVLGYTKRIAERLTAWAATRSPQGLFLSVRFGNVLGSRGSILETFQHQISVGGPVTVTHPEVTRFFMTVDEAVRLVLQSAVIGAPGEVLVFDMGEPVPIRRLAEQLISGASEPVEIVYTGLRRGEKLHEELLDPGEVDRRPSHPLIAQVPVPPLDPAALGVLGEAVVRGDCVPSLVELWAWEDDGSERRPVPDDVGYAVVSVDGRMLAANDLMSELLTGQVSRLEGLMSTSMGWRAYRADGTSMPRAEHPTHVTRATGRAVEGAVVGIGRASDGRCTWARCSTWPIVSSTDGAPEAIVVLIRPAAWDPDPTRLEVTAELARAASGYPAETITE